MDGWMEFNGIEIRFATPIISSRTVAVAPPGGDQTELSTRGIDSVETGDERLFSRRCMRKHYPMNFFPLNAIRVLGQGCDGRSCSKKLTKSN